VRAIIVMAKLACHAYCCCSSEDGAKRAAATRTLRVTCRVIGDQLGQRPKESNRDMSLDDQKAKSGNRLDFNATEYIVYPAHGVGQILSIEEQTVAGASLEFFVIFFAKSKMTLRVPVRKAANVGMRKPSDLSSVQVAKQILSEAPRKVRGSWSRLAQEYESKINSGDIVAIAEVARDLFRPGDSGQSFSERQLYVSALDRLCGEIALVNGISEEQAVEELEGLLKTSKLKRSA